MESLNALFSDGKITHENTVALLTSIQKNGVTQTAINEVVENISASLAQGNDRLDFGIEGNREVLSRPKDEPEETEAWGPHPKERCQKQTWSLQKSVTVSDDLPGKARRRQAE